MFKVIRLWFHENFGSCSKFLGAPEPMFGFVPVERAHYRNCSLCGKRHSYNDLRPSEMQAYHKNYRDAIESVGINPGKRSPERQRVFQAQSRTARRAGAKHRAKVVPMSKYHDHDVEDTAEEIAEIIEQSIQRDPEPTYVEREPEPTPVSYDSPSSSYDSGSDSGD
ncbi:hypothetical protein [Vibrio phage VCPH]|nr:hypothetical protein [Vibrio phage VCPH]